uniref:Uncharacterized protein n=1 Tax=uncultured bacterium BAC10-10 TaxID=333372 RepID=Q4JIP7_9BACT|nr:hypothetical protein [uncultured bacterium BAC10-10]
MSAVVNGQNPMPADHIMPGTSDRWTWMYDGVLFATFSHQTGLRGSDEIVSTDWVMGMASRRAGPGTLTLTGMASLERATTGARGYRELFQVGETYHFVPIVDRQHPHDLLMQASVAWRLPLDANTGITFAAAPVGEPALGPVAFMHRASAAENSVAPLSHHTLDSTHISMGVISVGVDRGPWVFESSVFQSGEPDDNRWDLIDFGPLDSWSARVSYRASGSWEFQGSHGYLKNPEWLEFAHVRRTTGSASWFRRRTDGFTAATLAFGQNQKEFHGTFRAALGEITDRRGRVSLYGRAERVGVETELLRSRGIFHSHTQVASDGVTAATVGVVIDVPRWKTLRRFEAGLGAEVTSYVVPSSLRTAYGNHPVAMRVFLRVRPPAGTMGRMWNMRMARATP